MRYEDASGAFQASGPVANDDSDTLAAGSRGPATGNLITGEGTQYGSSGADSAAGAHITSIGGKGGEDSSFAGGKLSVAGEFGQLSVDAEGNYSYLANKGAPENVRDRFTYTLADNAGNSDTASLIVEIGKTPVVIKADAQQIVPGPDGVVTLPPGVELSDIMVVGRNLVINMPDGTQLVIVDGAIFVPQLVLGGVEVPASNVAALLIGQEPQPAAGETPPSSGGNFALPPPPLDPGVPLGDLLPPTEYTYRPPEPQETFLPEDNEPEIFVQPDGQPATVAAVDQVEEAGLPERDGDELDEPAGSGESADGNGADNDVNSETTTGNIVYTSEDTPNLITVNGVEATLGAVIHGLYGDLLITSVAPGVIGYSYTLHDNTDGNDTHDDFLVELVDADGDIASATLRIDIIDDVPTARPDTDAVGVGEFIATGNVMTDAAPGDAGDSDTNAADTVGADDASLTSVSGAGGSDSTFSEGVLTVAGQYGVLTIDAEGNYEYVRNQGGPGGVQDVFNYTLTDGDGDTSTTTLTITIPDAFPDLPNPDAVLLDDDALEDGIPGGVGDDVDSDGTPGQLQGTGGDGDLDYAFTSSHTLPSGFTTNLVNFSTLQILQGGTVVLTVTLNTETGAFSVVQNAPIDHPAGLDENNLSFGVGVQVVDSDGDTEGATITINVDDDTPIALEAQVTGVVDEDGVPGGIAGGVDDVAGEDTVATGSVTTLFASGADTPLTYSLLTDTSGLPALTSGGVAITYVVDGNTLTASAGSNTVFTFTLNGNGSWTFTLVDQIDHAPGDNENNTGVALGSIIQATDADGDSVEAFAGGLIITIDDDTPTAQDISVNQPAEDANVVFSIVSSIAGGADGVDLADVTFGAHNGSGSLSYDNGVFTYDPAPGEEGDVTFTYTIVDGDGDPVTKTVTIHLQPDDVPQVGAPENLEVDEDGFAFANDDAAPLQSNPSETDHGENLTDSGQVVVSFGNDVPGNLANSIVLVDSGALDGQLVDLGGNPVTFALVGGQLIGTANSVQVMIISITGAVPGPGAGQVTYTYQAQLLQPVQHADVGNTENSDLLSNVQFQVTDSDGDIAGGSFNVTVWDDVPSANNDVDGVAIDGTTATGNVLTGTEVAVSEDSNGTDGVADVVGADAPGRITFIDNSQNVAPGSAVPNAGSVVIAGQFGNLTIFSNGDYSYARTPGQGGGQSEIFTYTLTDADGDEVTATLTINIGDNIPQATTASAAVDDDALGGNPDGNNDINANTFPTPDDLEGAGSSEATFRGMLGVIGGDGDIDFSLIAPGAGILVGQETVTISGSAGSLTATITNSPDATRVGDTLFTVTLNQETGEYIVTLVDNVLHLNDANNDEDGSEVAVNIPYQVVDQDGDPSGANGSLTIVFNDDVPTARSETDSVAAGTNGPATGNVITAVEIAVPEDGNGTDGVADTVGADGASVTFIDNTLNGAPGSAVPSGGSVVIAGQFGNLTIYANGDYSYARTPGQGGGGQEIFQYTLTDADGDESPATLTINIGDLTPVAGTSNAKLDDDGLGGANTAVGTDDINANDGSETGAGVGNEAIYTGTLAVTGGDGDIDFSLVIPGGSMVIGQETVTFSGNGASLTATIATSPDGGRVGDPLFTITLNQETGDYTLTLVDNVLHNNDPNENEDGTEISLNLPFQVVDQDGDASAANGTLNIVFNDDVPDLTAVLTGTQLRIDETDGVVAAGGEVDPAVGGNLGSVTHQIATLVNMTALFGADGAASGPGAGFSYALALSGAGVDSGFDYSSTNANILLFDAGTASGIQTIEGRVGGVGGPVAFSIAVNTTTGAVTLTQFLAVEHPDTASHDEVSLAGIAGGALNLVINATDADGDTDTASVDIGSVVRFEDDGPRITAASNINIQNNGDVAHTGTFDFEIGSDFPNPSNDDIKNVVATFTVNGNNVTANLQSSSETATTATYTYTFSYATSSSGGTANNTLVLTFDKVAGTYTVDLEFPIQPFTTINSTSGATSFLGYDGGTTNETNSQPDVVNVLLRPDNPGTPANEALWVRLTGIDEPGSGTGSDNLSTTSGDLDWTAGELITGAASWVSASNTANGVAGDIVNQGQVLNLDLFTANQFGNSTSTATTSAESIYFKLDNIGNQEDFVVILKLWSDTNGNGNVDVGETTTRAVYVANGDMIKGGGGVTAGPGQYSGVALDNNDALVIIESNDYNFGGETYKIIGAQISVTDEGISGTAIDLNGAINAASVQGGDNISDDNNSLGFKIQDIGFVSTLSQAQPAQFTFDVTVGDADGDTTSQTITATVTAAADSSTPIPLSPVVNLMAEGGSEESFSSLSFANDNSGPGGHGLGNGPDKNFSSINNTGIVAGIVAAAGLQSASVAAATLDHTISAGMQDMVQSAVLPAYQLQPFDAGSLSIQSFGLESREPVFDFGALQDSGRSFDFADMRGGLDIQSYGNAVPAYQPNFGVDQAQAFDASMLVTAAAPTVGMPSAEALIAAGIVAGGQHGGSVEQILADALGSAAPTVDGLLQGIHGGAETGSPLIEAALNAMPSGGGAGDLAAVLNGASPDAGNVSSWDMGMAGSFAGGFDMMFKMDVATLHQDAVQPTVNG